MNNGSKQKTKDSKFKQNPTIRKIQVLRIVGCIQIEH